MIDEREFHDHVLGYLRDSNPGLELEQVSGEDLLERGYLDSLRIIELVLLLEETFCVSIFLEDVDPRAFRTIPALYEAISAHLTEA